MGFFDFSKSIDDIRKDGEAAQQDGGLSKIDVNNTASAAILEEAKATRRTRSDKGVKRGKGSVSATDEAAAEALFAPDQWTGIVSVPSDIAQSITGSKAWELSKEEKTTLAIGAANTARHFATFHPKWLALSLFSMSALTIYGAHFAAYKLESKKTAPKPERNEVIKLVGDGQP
jgi:hypothetical protein